nr:MASE1 domain-containing protein [Actinopolymorpha pittospori]
MVIVVADRAVLRRCGVVLLQNLLTVLAYFAVAQPGLVQNIDLTGQARILFPAVGLTLAALLLLGWRVWPGTVLGSLAVSLFLQRSPGSAALIALATSVGPSLGYLLMRRMHFRSQLDRPRDAVSLVVFGAVVGMLVGSVLRTGAMVATGTAAMQNFWYLFVSTWVSSILGVLVVTPFLLVLRRLHWPRGVRPVRVAEITAILAATVVLTFVVSMVNPGREMLFLVFPVLIWAAWRFQLPGATLCTLIVSGIAVYSVQQSGPFADHDLRYTLLVVEAFIASASLAALLLSVAVTERDRARDQIHDASVELVRAVERLEDSLRPRSAPLIRQRSNPDPEGSSEAEGAERNGVTGAGGGPAGGGLGGGGLGGGNTGRRGWRTD